MWPRLTSALGGTEPPPDFRGARGEPALLPPPRTVKVPSRFPSGGGVSGPREESGLSFPAVAPRTSSVGEGSTGSSDRSASLPDPAVLRSPQPTPGCGQRPRAGPGCSPQAWGREGQGSPSAGQEGSTKNPMRRLARPQHPGHPAKTNHVSEERVEIEIKTNIFLQLL